MAVQTLPSKQQGQAMRNCLIFVLLALVACLRTKKIAKSLSWH